MSKRYKNTEAVKKVSLSVEKGEFLVILGPSGSGKSTLLRLIAGLEDPDEGDIVLEGIRINDIDPKDRNIAMVFQSYAVYPHMTVYGNIEFPLRMRKIPENERKRKVREVAELLGITHLLEKKAWQLSGGEQQRVALARALVRDPKLFLLDEPLSNLDAKLRTRLRFELRRLLHDELKITTLYVTHDQVEAMTMADRIAIMNQGSLVQVDTPFEIFNRPRNIFVATFVGTPSMNLLKAEVINQHTISLNGFIINVKKKLEIRPGRIILGIRPQHLTVTSDGTGFRCRVTGFENLGEEVILRLDTSREEIQVVAPWRVLRKIIPGQELTVRPIDKLYMFSEDSSELLAVIEPNEYTIPL
ncbi:MAG: ABC transporter ATP-binding protein [Sulfolobales archaeon]